MKLFCLIHEMGIMILDKGVSETEWHRKNGD